MDELAARRQSLISVSNRKNVKKRLKSLAGKVKSTQTPITIWRRTFTASPPPTLRRWCMGSGICLTIAQTLGCIARLAGEEYTMRNLRTKS